MSWKRTRAKKALIEVFSTITSEDIVFNYKEIGDKIYVIYKRIHRFVFYEEFIMREPSNTHDRRVYIMSTKEITQ